MQVLSTVNKTYHFHDFVAMHVKDEVIGKALDWGPTQAGILHATGTPRRAKIGETSQEAVRLLDCGEEAIAGLRVINGDEFTEVERVEVCLRTLEYRRHVF